MSDERFKIYIEYIKNTGGNPKVDWFVEDWEPIGETILSNMINANIINISVDKYKDQRITLK